MMKTFLFILFGLVLFSVCASSPTPVVLWHGLGDSCCNPESMGYIKDLIEKQIPGVYVKSIEIGATVTDDIYNSFFKNVNDQVSMVCQMLAEDSNLTNGFHAVGFSQGGQFLRGYVERCNSPPVKSLISVGGQHQGVYGFPNCLGANVTLCGWLRDLLDIGAYVSFVQDRLVPAEYWQDPYQEDNYNKLCVYLPDINNNGATKNNTYKEHLTSLDNFVLVMFDNDTVVQPKESEWFGFYLPGQGVDTYTLQESQLYIEDWIGVKTLDDAGKLHFLSTVGNHLQFTAEWFIKEIVTPYLTQ